MSIDARVLRLEAAEHAERCAEDEDLAVQQVVVPHATGDVGILDGPAE